MADRENTGKTYRNLYFYVIYWIAYLMFFSVQRLFAMKEVIDNMDIKEQINFFKSSFFTNLIFLPLVIIASHFVVSYLLPKLYYRNRFYLFSLIVGLTILFYPVLIYFMRLLVVDKLYPNPEKYSLNNYFAAMLIFVFGMAPLAWYEIARHLRVEDRLRQKIDKDRLEALLKLKEAELKLLKNQIQPHFLFNTLNNLYSLALEKSDRTPELIIRLSDMLSYIIYDCKSEKVPLSKEIEFIKNYIELQKVRFETCEVSFSSKCDPPECLIAPMILHTFIDNSFKHGAEKDPGNPWIRIRITSQKGILFLAVVNSTCGSAINNKENQGIGIANTRKRLEMIYRERHELVLHNSGKKFSVFLKMQL